MKSVFKIKEVRPQIFLFDFKDNYQMCMHFLRYQEFYESPSSKIRGKAFSIIDFMEYYSKEFGYGKFTYTQDWGGFNIPGKVIPEVHSLGILDLNKYDRAMFDAYTECASKRNNFYIIGATKGEINTIKHEIAHAFFQLKPKYKKEMTKLVKALPQSTLDKMYDWLHDHGYVEKVFIDEIQAYFSTGKYPISDARLLKPFVDKFEEYYKVDK